MHRNRSRTIRKPYFAWIVYVLTSRAPSAADPARAPAAGTVPSWPMSDPEDRDWGMRTRAIHAGARPDPTTGARAVPIYQTTSFVFENTEDAADLFALQKYGNIYSRLGNPTVAAFEERDRVAWRAGSAPSPPAPARRPRRCCSRSCATRAITSSPPARSTAAPTRC